MNLHRGENVSMVQLQNTVGDSPSKNRAWQNTPRHPNTLRVGVWTPKHLPEVRLLGVPNTYSPGIWMYLEDFGGIDHPFPRLHIAGRTYQNKAIGSLISLKTWSRMLKKWGHRHVTYMKLGVARDSCKHLSWHGASTSWCLFPGSLDASLGWTRRGMDKLKGCQEDS